MTPRRIRDVIRVACLWLCTGMLSVAAAQQPAPPSQQQADLAAGDAAFQRQDWPAAVEAYQRALASGMNHGLLHFRLGYALHVTGNPEEALEHHKNAVQLPLHALRIDALHNCACACALLGRKDEALGWLERAVDAGFVDLNQVRSDTDLDSLRADPRFIAIVAGIGKTPRLHQWMDFFIGEWTCRSAMGPGQEPEEALTLTVERPLAQSQALVTTSVQSTRPGRPPPAAPHWTGLLYPDAAERVWKWTYAGAGTLTVLTGERTETGMCFTGREVSPAGPGAHIRLTYTPRVDGSVLEVGETSDDGRTWRVHHEAEYAKKSVPGAPDGR